MSVMLQLTCNPAKVVWSWCRKSACFCIPHNLPSFLHLSLAQVLLHWKLHRLWIKEPHCAYTITGYRCSVTFSTYTISRAPVGASLAVIAKSASITTVSCNCFAVTVIASRAAMCIAVDTKEADIASILANPRALLLSDTESSHVSEHKAHSRLRDNRLHTSLTCITRFAGCSRQVRQRRVYIDHICVPHFPVLQGWQLP